MLKPIEWSSGRLRLLDQTRLPHKEVWLEIGDRHQLADAIRSLRVRGAPAIGVAAAYGLALTAHLSGPPSRGDLLRELQSAADELRATRPTAVNLSWALDRVLAAAQRATDVEAARLAVIEEAERIEREDLEANRRLGRLGAGLLPDQATVLTHCNAGALATAGYGTALGVIRAAVEAGKRLRVYVTETRPLLQGARLTAWELVREGVPCSLIVDGAAGALMRRGAIDAVLVGADRIAANGDTANKIGTYPLAVLARRHDLPFYVAAPASTVDLSTPSGREIRIEERAPDEVASFAGQRIAPQAVGVVNEAFDVTPAELIGAIITERGIARPPYASALREVSERLEIGA